MGRRQGRRQVKRNLTDLFHSHQLTKLPNMIFNSKILVLKKKKKSPNLNLSPSIILKVPKGMGKIYVSFPYSALRETLKCVSFRYYTSLHNWYIDSTSVFNILQILPKNHYCKHEKVKSNRRIKEFRDPIFPNLSDLSCFFRSKYGLFL